MTATVENLNANERRQEFQQWVTTQVRERKITEDELKAILTDFGLDVPSKVRPKDRGTIKTLIEAQVEAKRLAQERREDWMWDRLEAIQLTMQRPAQLCPENTYTELNPEGLKEFWKLMVESRENDPDENNGILREWLWRNSR